MSKIGLLSTRVDINLIQETLHRRVTQLNDHSVGEHGFPLDNNHVPAMSFMDRLLIAKQNELPCVAMSAAEYKSQEPAALCELFAKHSIKCIRDPNYQEPSLSDALSIFSSFDNMTTVHGKHWLLFEFNFMQTL